MRETLTKNFLAVRDIHKRFGGVHALRGVSITIELGQIYHLLGENGSGKSTLIKILSGAQAPDEGIIELRGIAHKSLTPIKALGAGVETVYQDLSLMPNLTVAENVALQEQLVQSQGSLAVRLNRSQLRSTAQRALNVVDLPATNEFLNTPVNELPLAVRQLVAIARAVATKAGLVIMDEPTTSLTKREVENLILVVKRLQGEGVAVLFVTHKLDECYQIGGNAIVFRDGSCLAQGPIASYTKSQLTELMTGRVVDGLRYRKVQPQMSIALAVSNLSWGDALQNVSFKIEKGEILGVTGLLDSGRNTLALVLSGVLPIRSGTVEIDGQAVKLSSPGNALKCGIGYVPEDRLSEGLFLDKPITTNLTALVLERFANAFGFVNRVSARAMSQSYVTDLKIATPNIDLPVQSLSGGNQQRVLIGRALSNEPKVLILHGPTVGVDVGSKESIHRAIQALSEKGMSVMIVSDDLPELLQNCDRILVMRKGKIAAEFEAGSANENAIFDVMVAEEGNENTVGNTR